MQLLWIAPQVLLIYSLITRTVPRCTHHTQRQAIDSKVIDIDRLWYAIKCAFIDPDIYKYNQWMYS